MTNKGRTALAATLALACVGVGTTAKALILEIFKSRSTRTCALAVLLSAGLLAVLTGQARAAGSFVAVDLGTLGGQHSFAHAISDNGQVVGGSYTTDGSFHAFSWTQSGGMVDLGTFGGSFSDASLVSADGRVFGQSERADGTTRLFTWTPTGGMVDVGTLGGFSMLSAVNASGQAVGASFTDEGQHAFLWTQGAGMVDLGTLTGSGFSFATAVSDTGQVVGYSPSVTGSLHAFSWTQTGGMVDLGTLGGNSGAYGVRDDGKVLGVSTVGSEEHAFSWTDAGGMVDLGTLPLLSGFSYFVAVNREAQFVGKNFVAAQHAFSWTPGGGSIDLTLGGLESFVSSVNAGGQVVGSSYLPGDFELHAFSWTQADGIVDLGTFGGSVSQAHAVNEKGQIVGESASAGAFPTTHAVLWKPSLRFVFHGFFQPIDNNGVFNVVTAGKAVPVKFDLNGDQGLAIFAAGYPASPPVACDTAAPQDTVEQTITAGSSNLRYDSAVNPPIGQYVYVWKTNPAWAGTCRQLQLKLTDGQVFTANFSFTR